LLYAIEIRNIKSRCRLSVIRHGNSVFAIRMSRMTGDV
jgi:hypothetical protein